MARRSKEKATSSSNNATTAAAEDKEMTEGWTTVDHGRKSDDTNKAKDDEKAKKSGEKRKIVVETEMDESADDPIESITETVKEKIAQAGEKDTGMKNLTESTLRIEFNLGHEETNFKAREQLLRILQKVAFVDSTVYAKSIKTNEEWLDDKSFPTGEKFLEEFVVRQQTNVRGYTTMVLYMKLVHLLQWSEIKYAEVVMSHLKRYNIFVFIDAYDTKRVGSPGFLTELHPRLVRLDALKYELEAGMKQAKCDDEKVVKEWKENHPTTTSNEAPFPKFSVYIQNKKWGQVPNKIDAPVFVIQSAAEDAGYLKTLLSKAYDDKLIRAGKFIPQGMVKIAGEEAYKNALLEQNAYIKEITSVAIVGLHKDALWADIQVNGVEMTLEHYLNHAHPYIEQIQSTKTSETEGRWLLVCKKCYSPQVIKFVDKDFPQIFEHIGEPDKFPGYEFPIRTITSGNKTVGSYAEKLMESLTPKSYLNKAYDMKNHSAPAVRPAKRVMVQTSQEYYGTAPTPAETINEPNKQTTEAVENKTTNEIDHDEKIKELDAKFQKQLQDMRNDLQREMSDLRTSVEKQLASVVEESAKANEKVVATTMQAETAKMGEMFQAMLQQMQGSNSPSTPQKESGKVGQSSDHNHTVVSPEPQSAAQFGARH